MTNVATLPRLARPSSALGYLRLGEAMLGFGGFHRQLSKAKSSKASMRATRDEEHLESALGWRADAFVTDDIELLRFRGARARGLRVVTPSQALDLLREREAGEQE